MRILLSSFFIFLSFITHSFGNWDYKYQCVTDWKWNQLVGDNAQYIAVFEINDDINNYKEFTEAHISIGGLLMTEKSGAFNIPAKDFPKDLAKDFPHSHVGGMYKWNSPFLKGSFFFSEKSKKLIYEYNFFDETFLGKIKIKAKCTPCGDTKKCLAEIWKDG